ncbi:MAG: hypothetical protein R3F56_15080 [Planctomycetota bacterium]
MTDPTPPNPTPPPVKPTPAKNNRSNSVLIRPWPKVVFFYPTAVVALLAWFYSLLKGEVGSTTGVPGLGNFFLIILFVNLLVFSFDFSRIKSITIVLGLVALLLGLAWANTKWGVWDGLARLMSHIDVRMNTQFFGFLAGFFAFIFLLVLINTRFNYYEVNHREILHHHGYLGDITRVPTAGLQHNKEIYDILEFVLLRSGRLIFFPASSRNAIVIDNVLNVNHVEARIKDLLSVIAVREMQTEGIGEEAD